MTVAQLRRYDAGSQSTRLSSWLTSGTDATAAIQNPATIRDRARDLVRNNPWAAKGLSTIVNNAIGYGVRCQITSRSKTRAVGMQKLWEQWAETIACDADGMHDFYGLQQLIFRAMVESGEVLVRLRPRRPEDRLPVPIQLQVIESDLLADSMDSQIAPGNTLLRGIEFDPLGRRVAYHLYKNHPGSLAVFARSGETTRVPAEEIIHLFRKDRPGQDRGVSWFAPVAVTLRELSIYEDAYLKRSQLANLFAGFLISSDPNEFEDELATELPDLQPGTMYALKPGSSIEFTNPPPAGEDPLYRDSCLRRVAAGMGVTYEALTGDLSKVNFSSARMGAHEMGRNIDSWVWNLFIPRVCQRVLQWFLDAATLQTGVNTAGMSAEWTPPARTVVDPRSEYEALVTASKGGLMTLPEAIRQLGYDPQQVAQEQAEYLALLDSLGVKVESDFRNNGKSTDQTTEAAKAQENQGVTSNG